MIIYKMWQMGQEIVKGWNIAVEAIGTLFASFRCTKRSI